MGFEPMTMHLADPGFISNSGIPHKSICHGESFMILIRIPSPQDIQETKESLVSNNNSRIYSRRSPKRKVIYDVYSLNISSLRA